MGSLDLEVLFASWKPWSSALKVEAGVGMGAGFGWRGVRIQGRPNGLEFVSREFQWVGVRIRGGLERVRIQVRMRLE